MSFHIFLVSGFRYTFFSRNLFYLSHSIVRNNVVHNYPLLFFTVCSISRNDSSLIPGKLCILLCFCFCWWLSISLVFPKDSGSGFIQCVCVGVRVCVYVFNYFLFPLTSLFSSDNCACIYFVLQFPVLSWKLKTLI